MDKKDERTLQKIDLILNSKITNFETNKTIDETIKNKFLWGLKAVGIFTFAGLLISLLIATITNLWVVPLNALLFISVTTLLSGLISGVGIGAKFLSFKIDNKNSLENGNKFLKDSLILALKKFDEDEKKLTELISKSSNKEETKKMFLQTNLSYNRCQKIKIAIFALNDGVLQDNNFVSLITKVNNTNHIWNVLKDSYDYRQTKQKHCGQTNQTKYTKPTDEEIKIKELN